MTSLVVITLFAAGIITGRFFRKKDTVRKDIDRLVTWAVYLLLFLLGISVGINDKILNDFSKIGYTAVLLTIGAVSGSILLAAVVYHYFFRQYSSNDDTKTEQP
jgi:uncharacterized membrane protein YbjE (DUF340 family)